MSKFKEWFATTPGSADPDIWARRSRENEYRNTWLAAMRESAKMACEGCRESGRPEIDAETGQLFHDVDFEDDSYCYSDQIYEEIEAVEKGE